MIQFTTSKYLHQFSINYIKEALDSGQLTGDCLFTKKCQSYIEETFSVKKALMTTSCTDALELSAFLIDIKEGDEIIVPSFTFVSSVNPFVLRGAKIKFIDIDPLTMNMNVDLVEAAITKNTKAIIAVHYAGIAVDMDKLIELSKKYNIFVVEDAAQGVFSYYKNQSLGTIGDIGAFSFHNTKNYVMGEGGAILLNDASFIEQAEIFREKGTNRSKFILGQVDKYTWIDKGSSFLPSDLNCALLYGQLENYKIIKDERLLIWERYSDAFKSLAQKEKISLPYVPEYAEHNGHMFYIKCGDINHRAKYIQMMKDNDIVCSFHYLPLHSCPAGLRFGEFIGKDLYSTKESERLVRLPLYYGLAESDQNKVIELTVDFFNN